MTYAVAALVLLVGQPSWDAYRPVSPEVPWVQAVVFEDSDFTIETGEVKFRIDVSHTGLHRELPVIRAELFRRWAQSLEHPAEWAELCAHEIQVEVGEQKHWLSLQNSLLEPFAAEAQEGSLLRLHIMYLGAAGEERVFMINSFEVLP